MPEGRLVPDRDWEGNFTGVLVCVSCLGWNCQHARGEICDIRNCGCKLGYYVSPITPTPQSLNGIPCGIYAPVTPTLASARLH